MAVAALRRYQSVSPFAGRSAPDACRNVIGILLNGMVRHAVAAAPEDFEAFADQINSLAESIEPPNGADPELEIDLRQMVLTAHTAVEAFEAYTLRASQDAADRENEFREIILTVAEGFFALAESSGAKSGAESPALERLAALRHELRSAEDALTLRRLKSRVAENIRTKVEASKTAGVASAVGHARDP